MNATTVERGPAAARPRVCVIGAGVAGLAVCQALRKRAIEFDCYEASDEVGGLWHFDGPTAPTAAYRSVHTIVSRRTIGYRCFPIPDHFPDFPGQRQFHDYLRSFADHFDLRRSIRFSTPVRSAERRSGGGWLIRAGEQGPLDYDVLIVASGHLSEPAYPDFPGGFEGPEIHAQHYVDPGEPLDLVGKRVLVVGIGNSAVDIASELSRKGVAEAVTISTRSGAWVIPKYAFGVPFDRIARLQPYLPLGPQRFLGGRLVRLLTGDPSRFGLPAPNHRFLEAHPTVSSELLLRLGQGDLTARPDVAELRPDGARFLDGAEGRFDAIVYATGYRVTFPYFDPDFFSAPDRVMPLYLRVFKPGIDDLAFVGFAEGVPSQPVFDELQAELVASWLGGEWALPSVAEMKAEIAADQERFSNYKLEHLVPLYERELRRKAIPAGRRRAARASNSRPAGALRRA